MKAGPMYEAYFQLKKRPFSATPDATCFFAPGPTQELFDELVLRAAGGQGIGVLTGQAGTGKTLVCRRIAAELTGAFTPLFLANANFPTRRALLQSLLFELGRRYSGLEEQELRLAVFASLKELTLAGRGAVLIVDEAHLLNDRLLEELRMLASLAEGDEPLARVILAGQLALEERLTSPALEALNQRVVCQAFLEPLTREQSIEYINFRIEWAGGDSARIFMPKALDRIALACNGLPRCLNQLCDHVLLLTYVQEARQVTEEAVAEALVDLKQLPLHWNTLVAADEPADVFADESIRGTLTVARDSAPGDDAAPAAGGETACFEVGGATAASDFDAAPADDSLEWDDSEPLPAALARPEIDAPSVSLDQLLQRQRRQIVPDAAALPADSRAFVEECVDDRYAALDVRLPRFSRTFEDAAVPESWLPPRQLAVPAAPQPPKPAIRPPFPVEAPLAPIVAVRPDLTIDDMLPLIDEACGNEWRVPGSAGEFLPRDPAGDLDAEPRPFGIVEPYAQPADARPIEEQLNSSVLDACLEVQTTIGQWHDSATGMMSTLDPGHGPNDSGPTSGPGAEYDVIEPESTAARVDEFDEPFASARREPAPGRYVPKPKYRHVFSTLRRRIQQGRQR